MKSSSRSGLRRARRLFRHRDYKQLINYLEPQVFMYRENEEFYRLLGLSCLYSGDYSGAHSYLMRAHDIDNDDSNTLLALGVVFLKHRQIDRALQSYLSILDLNPSHRTAKRALSLLRTIDAPEEVIDWFETRKINRIMPPRGIFIPKKLIVAVLIVALVASGVLSARSIIKSIRMRPDRPGSEVILLTSDQIETERSGQFSTVLTEREIESIFRNIRRDFDDGRDNLVRRNLNRIANSNAALNLKDRAEMMWDYLTVPDFSTFDDNENFTYREVSSDSTLYDNTYVRWRGRVANLETGTERISFDLLVGYESAQVLEGIVPSEISFAVLLENGQPVECIARVVIDDGNSVSLDITNIRILPPDEVNSR